jgi:hypothetical protein
MSSLKAMQLLYNLAFAIEKERENFSREQIVSKINKIKYLSDQKGVPRFVIKKEVVHLENQLQHIFEIETLLKKRKTRESYKITSLKREITQLKKKMSICNDKEITAKIEKLSYLLGDTLAKCGTAEEIHVYEQLVKEMKSTVSLARVPGSKTDKASATKNLVHTDKYGETREVLLAKKEELVQQKAAEKVAEQKKIEEEKVAQIHSKLAELKVTLELARNNSADKDTINLLEQRVALIESKLGGYMLPTFESVQIETHTVSAEPPQLLGVGRHDILFESQQHFPAPSTEAVLTETEVQVEELPYPPPPRVKTKVE